MRLPQILHPEVSWRLVISTGLLIACSRSHAAAPVYFELEWLFQVAAWLIVVVILGISALVPKSKGVRYALGGVLLLPVALIAYNYVSSVMQRHEASRLFDAYAAFCKQHAGSVTRHPTVVPGSASVLVRYATPDGQPKGMPYPDTVAMLFAHSPALCDTSTVREIQYVVPFANPVVKGTLNRTSTCPHRPQAQAIAEADADYELVLGGKLEEVTEVAPLV
ncbi:MAG: hypothetical protein HS128_15825 [Ideonella sp.]|nr:hypothetical protein [Ideonella sp.]